MVDSAKPEPCPFCGAHLIDITVGQTKPRWRHPSEVCPIKDWIITDVPVWNNRAATISDEDTRNIIEGLERHAGSLLAVTEKSLVFRAARKLKKTHIARASAEVAEHGLSTLKPPKARDLENEILKVLQRQFGHSQIRRHPRMAGSSNRQYTFDFAVPQGKRLVVIDAVEPEAASLQAKFTAHMDVKSADTKIEQRIVYDEEREWNAEDLALLQMAAQLMPLSKFRAEASQWN